MDYSINRFDQWTNTTASYRGSFSIRGLFDPVDGIHTDFHVTQTNRVVGSLPIPDGGRKEARSIFNAIENVLTVDPSSLSLLFMSIILTGRGREGKRCQFY